MKNIVIIFLLTFFFFSNLTSAQQASDPIPADKHLSKQWYNSLYSNSPRVYKGDQLKTIGMPIGGIAAGQYPNHAIRQNKRLL
jgi:hypothetical protein